MKTFVAGKVWVACALLALGVVGCNSSSSGSSHPTIFSISPTSGSVLGGTLVVVQGTNLSGTGSVVLGATSVSPVTVSATLVSFLTPAATAVGPAFLTINAGAGVVQRSSAFTYIAGTPTSISPASGPQSGGTPITITGTNFQASDQVFIDGLALVNQVVQSVTTITGFTPPDTTSGTVTVTVREGSVSTALSTGFDYLPGTSITITPASGTIGGNTAVTIGVQNLQASALVTIGGQALIAPSVNTGTSTITGFTPPTATAGVADVDITENGSVARLAGGYTYTAGSPLSITPHVGSPSGGTAVSIAVHNFLFTDTVLIGGKNLVTPVFVPANGQLVNTPADGVVTGFAPSAATTGFVDVSVVEFGVTTSLTDGFLYQAGQVTGNVGQVTSVAPASGPLSGGTSVTISGVSLSTASSQISIGGVPLVNPQSGANGTITGLTGAAAAPGLVDVTDVEGGTTTTYVGGFTYNAPTVSNIAPLSDAMSGGATITVSGANFGASTVIQFNGAALLHPSNSATTITGGAPPSTVSGPVPITIVDGAFTSTLQTQFTYNAPLVTTFTPNAAPASGGTSITITGTNFGTNTVITIGGQPLVGQTIVSQTQITGLVPASSVTGQAAVVAQAGTVSNVATSTFLYTSDAITITPALGTIGGNTAVTIGFPNLQASSLVTIGGQALIAPSVNTATSTITGFTPPTATAGVVDVNVTENGSVARLTGGYTYTAGSPLSITPHVGSPAGGTAVSIAVHNFLFTDTVLIGGNNLVTPVFVPTNGQLVNTPTDGIVTGFTPAAAAAGFVDVSVVEFGVTTSLADGFLYQTGQVTGQLGQVTSVVPASGPLSGGTFVTISGVSLSAVNSKISIGGVALVNPQPGANGSITGFTGAAAAPGLVDVTDTEGGATTTYVGGFTYNAPNVITVSPLSDVMSGGTTITVSGANFGASTLVEFNGNPLLRPSNTATTITGTAPPSTVSGPVAITIVDGAFTTTLQTQFTYNAPLVTTFTPNTAPVAGGTSITITGTSFGTNTVITIGGQPLLGQTVVSQTQITGVVPASSVTGQVPVVAQAGTVSNAATSTFLYSSESVSSVTPLSDIMSGGASLTVTGVGFSPTTVIAINGNPLLRPTTTSTTITGTSPPSTVSGPVPITVTDGLFSTTLPFSFVYNAPVVTTFTPNHDVMSGGSAITITGSNFGANTVIEIGGTPLVQSTLVSTTQITGFVPASVVGGTVTLAAQEGSVSNAAVSAFTYNTPALTSIATNPVTTPPSGPVTGGTSVVILGSNFGRNTLVELNGVTLTSQKLVSSTEIDGVTKASGTSGTVDVTVVESPAGFLPTLALSTLPNAFTYVGAVFTSISPATARTAGGTLVLVSGLNFGPNTIVEIGGSPLIAPPLQVFNGTTFVPATAPILVGTTEIEGGVPPAPPNLPATGLVAVTISDPTGVTVVANAFQYIVPTITSITPAQGSVTGGTFVTITGTNLSNSDSVAIGGQALVGATLTADGAITGTTPPAVVPAGTTVPVTITEGTFQATLTNGFTYVSTVFVATANAGSGNVSVFRLDDSKTPPISQVAGSPFAISGKAGSPGSLVIEPGTSGTAFVFVTDETTGAVHEFSLDPASGALTLLSQGFLLGAGPMALAYDPIDSVLFILDRADATVTRVSINPASGVFGSSAVSPVAGGPSAIAFVTDGAGSTPPTYEALLITCAVTNDLKVIQLSAGAFSAGPFSLTPGVPFASPTGIAALPLAGGNATVYVTNADDPGLPFLRILGVTNLGAGTPAFTIQSPFFQIVGGSAGDKGLVVARSSSFAPAAAGAAMLYISNRSTATINGYSLDATGKPTELVASTGGELGSPFTVNGTGPNAMTFDPQTMRLFVTCEDVSALAIYDVGPGGFLHVTGTVGDGGIVSSASRSLAPYVSPAAIVALPSASGEELVIANSGSGNIVSFALSAESSGLAVEEQASASVSSSPVPNGAAAAKIGNAHLYFVGAEDSSGDESVTSFLVNPSSGVLTRSRSIGLAGDGAQSIVVDETNGAVYVGHTQSTNIDGLLVDSFGRLRQPSASDSDSEDVVQLYLPDATRLIAVESGEGELDIDTFAITTPGTVPAAHDGLGFAQSPGTPIASLITPSSVTVTGAPVTVFVAFQNSPSLSVLATVLVDAGANVTAGPSASLVDGTDPVNPQQIAAATVGTSQFVYVGGVEPSVGTNALSIAGFDATNVAGGTMPALPNQPYPIFDSYLGTAITSMVVDQVTPTQSYLYVAVAGDTTQGQTDFILAFVIEADGELSPVPFVAGSGPIGELALGSTGNPQMLAVNGRLLISTAGLIDPFALAGANDALVGLDVDPFDGELSSVGTPVAPLLDVPVSASPGNDPQAPVLLK